MAHQLAVEFANIAADVVEVTEFPHLASRYAIYGVPKTVINEAVQFEGAVPEARFVEQVLRGVSAADAGPQT